MACPRKSVRAQVALQVQQVAACDGTKLVVLERPDVIPTRTKTREVIQGTLRM